MVSVGIDVSKGKSTICIMKPYGEIIFRPFEIQHNEKELSELLSIIKTIDDEVKVIMEATGIYHLPMLTYLQKNGIFVSVINPFRMKKFRTQSIRKGKTDKLDAITISNYGIEHWYALENYIGLKDSYEELKLLEQQYRHYMRLHVASLQSLTHLLDFTMPGIKELLNAFDKYNGRHKLGDFVEKYWHFELIKCKTREEFIKEYNEWANEMKYQPSQEKANKIYDLAISGISSLPMSRGSFKTIILEAVRVLKEIDSTLFNILSQMRDIATNLPEYAVVREMGGVGDVLATKLIAEIGDVRRFHSGSALIAYAGIDAPPYQSGKYFAVNRKISKRGSASLRKVGYETMKSLKTHKYKDDAVYNFIIKKELEGKPKKVAKIAGLNKFLKIYYARVKEIYNH